MGIWSFFFPSKSPHQETAWEIVETHLAIADRPYQVAVKKGQGELYAERLFQVAKNPLDLTFSRFLLLQEDPPKPHFAPSVKEAVSWFLGRNLPKDGYGHIWWGDKFAFKCATCQARREVPLKITTVEHMTVSTDIPHSLAIEGWRVIEVETELTVQALYARLRLVEVPVPYRARPTGSASKLRTFHDGFNVLWKLFSLVRSIKPLTFFGLVGLAFFALAVAAAVPVVGAYYDGVAGHAVDHWPLAVLAVGLLSIAAASVFLGLLLHAINWRFKELHSIVVRGKRESDR